MCSVNQGAPYCNFSEGEEATFTSDVSGEFTRRVVSIWPAADRTTGCFLESIRTCELAALSSLQRVQETNTRAQSRVVAEIGEICLGDVALLFCMQSSVSWR